VRLGTYRTSKWASFALAGLLIQDRFNGLELGRLTPVVFVALLVSLGAWFLVWEPVWSLIVPGPKIVGGEVFDFYRSARGSQQADDLQVLYTKIGNDRDGGGERNTATDVVAWMEAYDSIGHRVSATQGNWLDISARIPHPAFWAKEVTLRPTREEFGLEIAGKFSWGDDAWLAGEGDPPSLKPGTYVVRASLSDGKRKATVFEWELVNEGADAPLKATIKRRPS
jgi:hypothetical protein